MTFNFNEIIDAYGSGVGALQKIYGSNDVLLWEKSNANPNIYVTDWFDARYYKYNHSVSQYTDFTSMSQLNRSTWTGESDKIRLCIYNSKLYLQLSDYSYVRYPRGSGDYRLRPSNYYTTTDITKANDFMSLTSAQIDLIKNYTRQTLTVTCHTIGIQSFTNGVTYTGNNYQGTATASFGVPYLTAANGNSYRFDYKLLYSSTDTISPMYVQDYITYLLATNLNYIMTGGNTNNPVPRLKTNTRFRPYHLRYNNITTEGEFPFIYNYRINTQMNGVSIWESAKCYYIYSGYDIVLY